jgi:acetyl-CoA acetyltransferase
MTDPFRVDSEFMPLIRLDSAGMEQVVIAGVGIHPFGRFEAGYREIGAAAATQALAEAGIDYDDVGLTLVGNVNAEMAKGQNVMDRVGRPGRPIINVESACASAGSALYLGANLVESGAADIVLCVGVEKQPKGFIAASGFEQWQIETGLGVNPVYFALQAQELLEGTDATIDDLADVSVKNHDHAVENPNAMFRKPITRDEVLGSRMVCPPLTLLMLCAPNEGAAAAVLMSDDEARRRGVADAPRLRSVSLVSRGPDDWFVPAVSFPAAGRTSLTARAAADAYNAAGIGPEDIDIVECQDTDAASELLAYRDLGLCGPGEEAAMLRSGATRLGGRLPVNPSGGLLSKGEPLGASGLGQVHELVQQLRGRCGARQVVRPQVAVGHVMGAGHVSSVVVLTSS